MKALHATSLGVIAALLLAGVPRLVGTGSIGGAAACVPSPYEPAWLYDVGPATPVDLHVAASWLPDEAGVGTVTPAEPTELRAAYLRAWLQWNLSFLHCAPVGLDRYFTGPALQSVGDDVTAASRGGLRVTQADTAHALRLLAETSGPSGEVVRFADAARVVRVTRTRFGVELAARETETAYQVEMVRAGATWQVRAIQPGASRDLGPSLPLPPLRTPPGFVGVRGTSLVQGGRPLRLAGYNYFPKTTPWLAFWRVYDTAAIDRDLTFIERQGLNAVRVLIPYEQFGGPSLDPTYADRLADFLARCRAHHLLVIVALFDFHSATSPLLWAEADRQLEALLGRFADDPTIAAWDLRNEANLYYPAGAQMTIDAWLVHLARLARAVDPHHLLTVGWFRPEAATRLAALVDVVSYHYYDPVSSFGARYDALRRRVPDKPILLGEFGRTTFNPLTFLGIYDEADQAAYYRQVIDTVAGSDSAGYLAWTLHDFPVFPPTSWWPQPWQREVERHFGVLRLDGSPKPALQDVRPLPAPPTVRPP